MPVFALESEVVAEVNYDNIGAGYIVIDAPIFGLAVGDVATNAVFTAELEGVPDVGDAALSTIHHAIVPTAFGAEGIRAGTPPVAEFRISPIEARKLFQRHTYDIRVTVTLANGVVSEKVVQRGRLSVLPEIGTTIGDPTTGPQDGSVADLVATLGDANIVSLWDLSNVASVHVNGTTQIDSVDDVRGGHLPLIGALADGTLGSHKPGWDAVNKRARFTLGQPTQTRLATALDAAYRLNDQSLALVVWGGWNAGSGSYASKIQHADGLRGLGTIGAFGHSTFDTLYITDATHQYQSGFPSGNSVLPNVAGAIPRTRVITAKLPVVAASGFEGSFPFHSVESPGNPRVIMFASGLNEWTPFIAGNYQVILGGAVTEGDLRGAAVIKLDAFQDKALSRAHMAALERFGARIGCVATLTVGATAITCDGDSRMWGNGASNFNTEPISVQLQGMMGAGYHTQNRGIEGDSWHDRANQNPARVYTTEYWRQRVANDKDANRVNAGIHVYLLDVNDTNGPGTGSGFGNTTASADLCLAQLDVELAAAWADGKKVIVCGPIFPIVDPFRTRWLNGLLARAAANPTTFAVARTDLEVNLASNNPTYFTDGLHQTPAGMTIIATVIHDTIIAKGW
jgi:hypothetical protein